MNKLKQISEKSEEFIRLYSNLKKKKRKPSWKQPVFLFHKPAHVQSLFWTIHPRDLFALQHPCHLFCCRRGWIQDAISNLLATLPSRLHGRHLHRPCYHVLYRLGSKSPQFNYPSKLSFCPGCALRWAVHTHSATDGICSSTRRQQRTRTLNVC